MGFKRTYGVINQHSYYIITIFGTVWEVRPHNELTDYVNLHPINGHKYNQKVKDSTYFPVNKEFVHIIENPTKLEKIFYNIE